MKNDVFKKCLHLFVTLLFVIIILAPYVHCQVPYPIHNTSLTNSNRSNVPYDEDIIVYTVHQSFDSRIYLLDMNGSLITYYEYINYRLVDLEVINNEVYVSDAFIPCVYKVDIYTGNLELIFHNTWLYYFYGLAFDGIYFYVAEWDLNRYDMNGDKYGTASFDESVMGSAWDGDYYWTLDEGNLIKCWDISSWPNVTELPSNAFIPPSLYCRGLWFDGQYFWTAECVDDSLGYIYQFDYNGDIINQWIEPTFKGWSACYISGGITTPKYVTSLIQGWNFVSLPFNQSFDKVDIIVNYIGTNYTWSEAVTDGYINDFIFGWARSEQSYTFNNNLQPGYGYWMYAYVDCELMAENVSLIIDNYITDLDTDWNVVGVPHNESLDITSITVNYGDIDYIWANAVTGGIINNFVFGWNRSGQSYNFADTLMSGNAYWMYAYQPCTLKGNT